MFWLRNKKIIFLLNTLNASPGDCMKIIEIILSIEKHGHQFFFSMNRKCVKYMGEHFQDYSCIQDFEGDFP